MAVMKNEKAATETARGRGEWQGMNWIRQEKRLAIYLRDGLACVWCGDSVENGARLTLDHVIAHSKNGTNSETNLVTACIRCNTSRGNRSATRFAADVAGYLNHNVLPADVLNHVRTCTKRALRLHRKEALSLIARRGSAAQVLASIMTEPK